MEEFPRKTVSCFCRDDLYCSISLGWSIANDIFYSGSSAGTGSCGLSDLFRFYSWLRMVLDDFKVEASYATSIAMIIQLFKFKIAIVYVYHDRI
jgi:hypothetical protein